LKSEEFLTPPLGTIVRCFAARVGKPTSRFAATAGASVCSQIEASYIVIATSNATHSQRQMRSRRARAFTTTATQFPNYGRGDDHPALSRR
jgi:hypothetical protein